MNACPHCSKEDIFLRVIDRTLCSEHTHVRGLLIAKDNPPCGAGRRFPRALTISNDDTTRCGEEWREETDRACRGQIKKSTALDMDASGRQYLRNVNMSFNRECRLKGFERKSRTDNTPAAAQPPGISLKNKGTSLMFPVVPRCS